MFLKNILFGLLLIRVIYGIEYVLHNNSDISTVTITANSGTASNNDMNVVTTLKIEISTHQMCGIIC